MTESYEPFPEPLSIARIREDHARHVSPESGDSDALIRFSGIHPEHAPFDAMTMRVRADGAVTACECHEPVIEDGQILGLRQVAA